MDNEVMGVEEVDVKEKWEEVWEGFKEARRILRYAIQSALLATPEDESIIQELLEMVDKVLEGLAEQTYHAFEPLTPASPGPNPHARGW